MLDFLRRFKINIKWFLEVDRPKLNKKLTLPNPQSKVLKLHSTYLQIKERKKKLNFNSKQLPRVPLNSKPLQIATRK